MQNERHKSHSREGVMAMVAQVERQGDGITARYAGGEGISGRFSEFQAFVDQLDHYQLFIDMVEARLGNVEPEKRVAQAKHLTEIRWGILQIEIEATNIFLSRMADNRTPWPMGCQPFLRRRLTRLDDIIAFHTAHQAQYALEAPNATTMQAIRDQVGKQMGNSIVLDDFSIKTPEPAVFTPAPLSAEAPARKPAAKPAAKPAPKAAEPKRPLRLMVREADGYKYIDGEGLAVISEACRVANTSIDELAKGLELSRPGLVLILNGRDPVSTELLKTLRRFVTRTGGLI